MLISFKKGCKTYKELELCAISVKSAVRVCVREREKVMCYGSFFSFCNYLVYGSCVVEFTIIVYHSIGYFKSTMFGLITLERTHLPSNNNLKKVAVHVNLM